MADGILLMDKPQDFTSFDVVAKLRGIVKQRKIGHTGTLDPMATGVLPCLLGAATKLSDIIPIQDKGYLTTVQFGLSTDTQDITGKVLKESQVKVEEEMVAALLEKFSGDIMQLPPMYSAVSVNGQRLYNLARRGIEVERPSRPVTIKSLKMLEFNYQKQTAVFETLCTKGTYIRTLFSDLGDALGCGATLLQLRRTYANGYGEQDCLGFEDVIKLMEQGRLQEALLPVYTAFECYQKLVVGEWQGKMLTNGVKLNLDKLGYPEAGLYSVWCEEKFLGLGTVEDDKAGMRLKQF